MPFGVITVYASAHVAAVGAHLLVAVSQLAPCAQSALETQLVLQTPVVASHAYGGQFFVPGVKHMPEPSHVPPGCDTSPEQNAAPPHAMALPGYAHADGSPPSHLPWHIPMPAHATRGGRGAPITVLHVPTLPASAQAWHCPPHGESQQTPSTQKPLVHWFACAQALPFAPCATHTPLVQ
jgi:hypothetical protein